MANEGEFTAGRELDALVAARVFGAKILTHSEMENEARRVWFEQPQASRFLWGFTASLMRDGTVECEQDFKRYSTDIAAAWEVAEKLRASDKYVDICTLVDTPGLAWRAEVRGLRSMWEPVFAAAETAPLAICRAALKAVGGGLS